MVESPGTAGRDVVPPGGEATPQIAEPPAYRLKRIFLGKPLVTERLADEKLSNVLALGVLAPDCISSSAYGTEEMLVELLPVFGVLAFSLVLPITGVVLAILVLLTLSYREVVQVYTRAGGSYVVARENFGPRVAQVAAVALLIDYVVTVAVQTAAGTVAVVSAVPALGPYSLEITVGVVALLAYVNLRGLREAGRAFALPTYLFAVAIGAVIVTGVVRDLLGTLPTYDLSAPGIVQYTPGTQLTTAVVVLTLLRSFANGGSSLTGLEAISNGVGAFRKPAGLNARRVLVVMACILGFLVSGVSWMAFRTHAAPYDSGYPSVISQEARAAFGGGQVGTVLFVVVQAISALILYTGANTSFNGFPFLASFVAADSFLPRQLTKRGHRLVFSNGIVVLAVVAVVLLVVTGGTVNALVPFYAIGVFTGFTMAGFGMARYHLRKREHAWRRKLAVNVAGGALSLLVVLIFAVVKFTEGAWAVVVLFPVLVVALIRLNQRYRAEEAALAAYASVLDAEPNWSRHVVLVFVDTLDLATLRALRYARSLRPTTLRALHFVLDDVRAKRLVDRWDRFQRGDIGLELRECPDRRLGRASIELLSQLTADGRTAVSVLLPRRTYAPLLGRLLHDRTADHIAHRVSSVRGVAATIIPFDVDEPIRRLGHSEQDVERFLQAGKRLGAHSQEAVGRRTAPAPARRGEASERERTTTGPAAKPRTESTPRHAAVPIAELTDRGTVTIAGRVDTTNVGVDTTGASVLQCRVDDGTGTITARFHQRAFIKGVQPGARVELTGRISRIAGELVLTDPTYRRLSDDSPEPEPPPATDPPA
ncbi:amino acid permease [Pseudonocardia sp. RS11V-5]|uniref:APC family permease n=1 Tax=Pseudonocardia terrae TaxID=2905831 RepID=UPI001E2EEB97|nr:amino acid permease [Pseudonocardia terrae]MCE3549858.1 amino acid permease [Pseudonocardia terrae]